MAKTTKACPKEGLLQDVSKALARPGTSYLEATEKLRVPKNRVQRAAEELGGKQEAWSLLQMDENPVIAVAKLPALLTLLCARTPALFQAFHRAAVQAAEKPLSLILSFDEATAGNVLAPDPAKKACMVYIACKDVGMQNPALWWPVSVVRADIMKDHLHGNLGILLRHFLRTNPAEQLMAGFLVQATGHTPFILRVRISAVIADGEALRQSLSCKGAAGLKPCHICKNVIKKNHELTGSLQGYLQDISSLPGSWDRMTDEDIFQFCDEQRRRKMVLSAAAFSEEEKLAGIVYDEQSLIQDSWARLQLPPSLFMYDFLHIYFTKGGVASLEVSYIVQRAAAVLNVTHEDLAGLLREHAWRLPGYIKNFAGPANRARLFDSARFLATSPRLPTSSSSCHCLAACLRCWTQKRCCGRNCAVTRSSSRFTRSCPDSKLWIRLSARKLCRGCRPSTTSSVSRLTDRRYSARNTTGGFTLPNS